MASNFDDESDREAALPTRRRELEVVDASYVVVDSAPVREVRSSESLAEDWSWRAALLVGLVVALIGAAAWWDVLALPLAGWDTYPLIAASRVESLGDLGRVLTDELMGGRFPSGHYWRPLVHLSFALDHALGGLDPRAYHRTDLLATLTCAVATSWLALALLGPRRRAWAIAAGALVAMHPAFFELAPLPPRRADNLSLAFTLLALFAAARARARTSYAAAVFALLAAGAKETGVLCALLVPALNASFFPAGTASWSARWRAGLRASWPTLASIAVYLVARTALLGGLGGGAKASLDGALRNLGRAAERYGQLVLAPAPPSDWAGGGVALAFGVAALCVAFFALRARRIRNEEDLAVTPQRLAEWLGLWLLVLAALTAMSGVLRAWYAAPFVPPVALLAVTAAALVGGARQRGPFVRVDPLARRGVAWLALGVLALLQGWGGSRAMRWSEVRASSEAARELCERFDALAIATPPGSVVELDATPPESSASRHGVATKRPLTLRDYSLNAYAELAHPGRKLRVVAKREPPPQAAADELVIVLLGRGGEAGE